MKPTRNILALAAMLCIALGLNAQTTYYWIGSGGSWATASNWSLSSGGSASMSAPGSSDIAVFDNGGGNCTLAANASIGEVVIEDDYANTLDLDGHALTVSGDFTQNAGAFQGRSAAVSIGGMLHLVGGDFHATTGTTTVGGDMVEEGEYLQPHGGKFVFTGTGVNIDITTFFYDIEIVSGASAELANSMAVAHNLDLDGPLVAGENTVFIGNSATSAITGTSGIYLSIGDGFGIVFWGIGENTGTYTVPLLATPTGPVAPVVMDIATAGEAGTGPYDGYIMFLCVELDDTKPQDLLGDGVGYYDATGGNNADMNINRVWGMVLNGYDVSPEFDLDLNYTTADLTGISATEANLKAQIYDEKHWGELLGTLDAGANNIDIDNLTLPVDGRASFITLVDNTSRNRSTYGGNTGLTCSDAIDLEEAGMEEAVFRQEDSELWFKFTSADLFYDIFINAEEPYLTLLVDSVEIFSDSCDTLSKVSTIRKQDLESSLFGRAILTSTGDYFLRTRKSGLSITDFSLLLPRAQQFVFVMSDSTIANGAYTPATTNYGDTVSFCQDSIWLSRGGGGYPDSAYYYQFSLQRWDILLGTWTFYDTINVIPSVNLAKVFLPSGYYKASVDLKSYFGWVPSFLASVPVTFRIKTVDGALFLDKDPREVCIGEEVNFFCLNGQGGVPGSASPSANFDYFWNFGDGTSNHDAASVWHTYYMRGLYTVTVEEKATCRVLDYNISNSPFEVVRYFRDSIDIEVEGAEFSYDYICQQQLGDTSVVDIILYDDANCTSNYDIVWDLHGYSYNTSQTLTGDSASFQIRQPTGQYPVTMYLYDGATLIDSATQYINIIGKPEIIGQTMVCDAYHNYSVSNPTYADYYTWYVYNGGTLVYVDSNTTTLEYVGSSFTSIVVSVEIGSCIYWDTLATTDPCCYTSGSSVLSTSMDSISLFDQIYFSNTGTITTNVDIVFNGTIYINKNFTFLNCPNIYFAPNAKMIVMPGKTLTIEHSSIQAGCDTMWEGIYVLGNIDTFARAFVSDSAVIADAKNALVSDGGGRISIVESVLRDNYKHVILRNHANVLGFEIDTATIVTTKTLLPPFSSKSTAAVGIEVEDVYLLEIGSSVTRPYWIMGADTAISVKNSNVVRIDKSVIFNIGALLFGIPLGDMGIFGQGVANLEIGTNTGNAIMGMETGVNLIGCMNPKIIGNGFVGIPGSDGIVTQFLLADPYDSDSALIQYNTFDGRFKRGIYNTDNLGKLLIADNTMLWDSTVASTTGGTAILHMNVWLALLEQLGYPYAGKIAVWNNTIEGYSNGIGLINATGSHIKDNTVTIRRGGTLTNLAGVFYWNCPQAQVFCNDITANTNAETNTIGVWASTSAAAQLQCNTVDSTGRGLLFNGDNFFSWITGNTMRDNAVGLGIEARGGRAGFIGFNDGYYRYAADNRWQGGFTAHSRTYSNADGGLTPMYLRSNGSNEFLPIPMTNDVSSIFAPGLFPVDTFHIIPSNDSVVCTTCDAGTIIFNKKLALDIVSDTIVYPSDSAVYAWWDRYSLYQALTTNLDVLEEEEELEDFYDAYGNSFVVQLDGIKRDIRVAEMTTGFDEVSINGFQSRLNALSPANDMETNSLDFTWMYFGMARGIKSYEDVEDDVITLSEQCVFYGGPAVWEARSLRIRNDFDLLADTPWEDSCETSSSKWDGSLAKESLHSNDVVGTYKLIPNFFNGERTGSVDLGMEESGVLEIYTIDGKLTGSHNLGSGSNLLDLSNSLTSKGVYVYKLKVDGTYKTTDKLVVIE